ncbi:MAG: TatD family hydrolase [Gammaproteobacteria bacterium]
MTQYIDIGANLTHKGLMRDLEAVIQRARAVGVERIVVTGTQLEESVQAIRLCELYPDTLVCTAGIHPHHASGWQATSEDRLRELAAHSSVRAIGETGLDFNRNYSPRAAQLKVFHHQLEIAASLEMPVFAHQRDAHDEFVAILREHRDNLTRVVVHCFTDTRAALLDYLDLDCHIGVTGWICDERRGLELQQLVKLIPSNRLMVETDAPYLLPRNLPVKPASRVNEPAYLPHILQAIAHHQNKPTDELLDECLKTSSLFFDL